MNFLEATILGLVQGITEWLPISSDGHLVLLEKVLKLNTTVAFDVFLHLGSLVVIVVFFRRQLGGLLKSFFKKDSTWPTERTKWWLYLVVSTVVTGAIGLFLYPRIENFRNIDFAASGFLLTSIFVLCSKFAKQRGSFSYLTAIILGLVQGLAVLPGVSRSGLVLSTALLLGLSQVDAFDYAFILAIPAIAASAVLAMNDLVWQPVYFWGLLVTIVVGFASLVLLKKIVKQEKFYLFFIYTLILGLVLKLL